MRQFDFHPLVNSTWYLESQDGLCLTNCDGDLIHMNPAFLEQLGWDGWEGKRMEEVLPEWDAEGWRYKLKDGPERMGPLSISSPKAGLHLEGELVLLPIEGSEKLLLWALTKKPGKQEVWQKLIEVSRELLTQSGGSLDDQALNEIMHDFSGAFLTAFNRFDSGGERFKTVSLAGPAENLQKGLDILGFNPMKKVWDFDENKARQAGKENLTRYESLETLTGEVISQPLIRRIQSLFSLGSVVVIQIRGHQRHLGDFTLIMKKGQKVKNQEICEIYASIVGLHLERTEAELRRQEQVRRHEATIEATGAGTVEWEMTQDPPEFSRQCWALLGMTEEDKGLKTWLERVHPQDRPKVQHYLDEAGEKVNNTQELHFRVKHVDGQWRWIMSRSKLLKTEAGLPWRWVATLVDVTDLIQAQKQTILEKEFLSNVLEGTNAGTWEWDLERDQVYVNPRWREISGRSLVKPVSQEELFNSMEPGDALKARAQMKAVLDKREAYYAVEARFKSEEGRWVWILDHGRVIAWSEEGQPLRMFGTRMDITENKYLELARQDSEAQYKILIDNSFDIIYRLSEEGHFTYVSPAWNRLLAQSTEAVIGRSFRPYVHPEDLPAVEAFFEKIKITQQRQELEYYRLKHADGSWRWYFTNAIPIWDEQGLVVGFAGSARDVTALKETQDALIMQKDELERFFSINLDLLCIVQTDGRFVRVNKAWETTLGYPLESLLNKNILELIHPDDLEPTKKALETLGNQEEVVNFVNRYRCQDGSYRQIEWRSRPYGILVYAAARDITQRMNIEAQLHLEKEQFQTTLLSVADGVFSTDPNGRITLVNQAACAMLGWEFSEIKGRSLDTVLRISDIKGFSLLNLADQVIEKGEVFEIKDSTLTTRSGKQKRIEGSVAPVKDRSGNITGTVVVFRDVTDRVHREKEVKFFSFHDALTGLYNRRYMEDALQRLDGARNLPLTILFADVNGLKLTNDACGHRMGDKLLQVVAEILKKACRSDDILCRVGGDEFALLLPKTDYDQGMAVKRRILDIAETKTLEPLVISIGMGIATKRTPDQSLKEIQVQADQAMYQDKLKRGQLMRGETIERALKNICMLYTGEEDHILRVSRYCQEFAEGLNLGDKEIEEAKKAGLLHDIGKIALPPEMLNKKGALTQQQWREVRRHPLTGYHILKGIDRYVSLAEAVLYHHEHYDGTGYPRGLKGKKIPLLARMIAIADSYEAMTGERNYKKKMTQGEAVEELRRCSGSQFDPELAKVFLDKVIKIQE